MQKLTFQFRDLAAGYRAVAFNAPLDYFMTKVKSSPKGPVAFLEEMTVKDCRHIDGCVYFMKGRVPDAEIVRMIELYQQIKDNKGWKEDKKPGGNKLIL